MSKEYGLKCLDHDIATWGINRGAQTCSEILRVASQAGLVLRTIEDSDLHILGWYNDGSGPSLAAFLIEHGNCKLVAIDEYGGVYVPSEKKPAP